jgi:hypothetical protein
MPSHIPAPGKHTASHLQNYRRENSIMKFSNMPFQVAWVNKFTIAILNLTLEKFPFMLEKVAS